MGEKEEMAEWKWKYGEERDWERVRGQGLLIWRLNEPSDASDTPSDLLWSLAEWHHSGDGKKAGVGEGQKKKVEIIDGLQIPSNGASKGGSCGRQWKRPVMSREKGYLNKKIGGVFWREERKTRRNLSLPIWAYEWVHVFRWAMCKKPWVRSPDSSLCNLISCTNVFNE